jgi:hypothetical protein
MTRLEDACEAIAARKVAVFCALEGDPGAGVVMADDSQQRLILSGFGVDVDELQSVTIQAGYAFAGLTIDLPLPMCCGSAWTEGLLIGLMFAQLARAEELRGQA